MLNPSAADEERNDPTIRRCIGFARDWGFGLLEVVNLFALMSTDPKGLLETEDPVGPDNDATIQDALQRADKVILAWGNQGSRHRERAAHVMKMALDASNPHHLGMTKLGFPRHPLLLPRSTRPTPRERDANPSASPNSPRTGRRAIAGPPSGPRSALSL